MTREIIFIDEDKCTGCGLCIPNCPEGALQVIDGKARLVSDLSCDGLGACIGHCPEGAIRIERREAEPYDEARVMRNIAKLGENVILAHLEHLREHGEDEYLREAVSVLDELGIPNPLREAELDEAPAACSCPGAAVHSGVSAGTVGAADADTPEGSSALRQWPVQLHLVSPSAPFFRGQDVLLCADCVAYAAGGFHGSLLDGKSLAIACPKLDRGQEVYLEKIRALIEQAKINTLTVAVMEVPCCSGLLALAQEAVAQASRKIPVKRVVIGTDGGTVEEAWV